MNFRSVLDELPEVAKFKESRFSVSTVEEVSFFQLLGVKKLTFVNRRFGETCKFPLVI